MRIQDPETLWEFIRTVMQMYPSGEAPPVSSWEASRAEVTEGVMVFSVFIGLFGTLAAGVAAFVIVNVVAGNVLAQLRDIGLLKSVGFTPRQVTTLLLTEHVGLGLLAAIIGVAVGYAAAPLALDATGDVLGAPVTAVFDVPLMAAIVIGTTLLIAVTAIAPAWKGGRISTVQALASDPSNPQSRTSRAARLATLLRLPVVAVIGLKNTFNRPVRSLLTVAALLVAVILSTFGLGMEATLRNLVDDPRLMGGAPYELTATRFQGEDEISALETKALLDAQPEVGGYYGGVRFIGDLETSNRTGPPQSKAFIGATGDGYADLAPYIRKGRLFTGPGEAIVSTRTAKDRDLSVGDSFAFVIDRDLNKNIDMEAAELDLRVVGIYVDDNLEVVTSRDTFHQQLGLQIDPMAYRIKVAPGIDPESYRIALIRQESRLSVKIFDATEDNEKVAGNIRPPLYALMVALLAIGVLSLLITLLFSVRERYREFAVLKTLGFTPRQVGASVVSGSILLTGIALSIGIPLGVIVTRLSMDSIGHGIGVGKPFGFTPGPVELIILAPVILLAAILGSVIPARRAAGTTITEVLRSE